MLKIFPRVPLVPVVFLTILLGLQWPAAAETKAERNLAQWNKELTGMEQTLLRLDTPDKKISELRTQLGKLRLEAEKVLIQQTPALTDIRASLDKLGKVKKGEKEPESIARTREELNARLKKQRSINGGLELVILRAGQLDNKAASIQRSRFLGNLLKRNSSLFWPKTWLAAWDGLGDITSRLSWLLTSWFNTIEHGWQKAVLGGVFMLAILIGGPFRRYLIQWLRPAVDTDSQVDFRRQVIVEVRLALLAALPPVVAALMVYGAMVLFSEMTPRMNRLALAAIISIGAISLIRAIARAVLAPGDGKWRLGHLEDSSARRMFNLVTAMAVVFGFDLFLSRLAAELFMPLSGTIVESVIISLVIAALLAAVLRVPLLPVDEDRKGRFSWLRRLRSVAWLFVLAIVLSTLVGYVALGRFLATQFVMTATLVIGFYVIHLLSDEALVVRLRPETPLGLMLQNIFSVSSRAVERFGLALATFVDLALIVIGVPLILLQWGVQWEDLTSWISAAFFGVRVGNITISLSTILIALLVFITGIMLTRMTQRWLDFRVLSKTRLDIGVRNSIRTGTGYTGSILSVLAAFSYIGIGFSNIAIVAGALSVGIGFGLQSIVNNFVSGLILLAERPFKAGDWVVVGGEEGYVKKIKVRSTEIETFSRASLTIPNSMLITKPVKNWTHKSKLGRIAIQIGVAYDSDPEQVRDVLLNSAHEHPEIVEDPGAYIIFRDFGDSALVFELRAYLIDVDRSLRVSSDLRFAIFRQLKEHGIEIPFPQRDVHIKSQPTSIG